MSHILELIIQTSDSQSEGFNAAQLRLLELFQNQPIDLVLEIIMTLKAPNLQIRHVFLLISYLTHCFEMIVQQKIAFDIKNFENEILPILFSYFTCQDEVLRNSVTNFLSKIAIIDYSILNDQNFVSQLSNFLADMNLESTISVIDFIYNFCNDYQMNDQLISILFPSILPLITSDNVIVVNHIIQMLSAQPESIFVVLSDEATQNNFISTIIGYLQNPELRKSVYSFAESLCNMNQSYFQIVFQPVYSQAFQDINSESSNDVIMYSFYILIYMFNLDSQYNLVDLSQYAEELGNLCIARMSGETIDSPIDTNWDPPTAALQTLREMTIKYFGVLFPLLNAKLEEYDSQSEPDDRIVCSKCCLLICNQIKEIEESFSDIYNRVITLLDDGLSNVIYYSLESYSILVDFTKSCQPFLSDIESLMTLSQNNIYGEKSMICIAKIMDCPDFENFEIFNVLSELLPSVDIQAQCAIAKSFKTLCTRLDSINPEVLQQSLEVMLRILQECELQVAENLFKNVPYIICRLGENLDPFYQEIFDIFNHWLQQGCSLALPAISALMAVNQSKFQYQETLQIINETLNNDDPESQVYAIDSFAELYFIDRNRPFNEYDYEILLKIAQKISPNCSFSVRENALQLFPDLIRNQKIALEPLKLIINQYLIFVISDTFDQLCAGMDEEFGEFISSILDFVIACIEIKLKQAPFRIAKKVLFELSPPSEIPMESIQAVYQAMMSVSEIPEFVQMAKFIEQKFSQSP